jgi:hypothetical protein
VADQAAVMASVQHLRQLAQAAGTLQSTPQQTVDTDGGMISIEPPGPDTLYVPDYDPSGAYGMWPDPEFPPDYFPGFFDDTIVGGIGFGWFGVPIIASLWGWDHWDWHRHRIDIDRNRWAGLDHGHLPMGGGVWRHDPMRGGGLSFRDAAAGGRFIGGGPGVGSFRGYSAGVADPYRVPSGGFLPRVSGPSIMPHNFEFGRGGASYAHLEPMHGLGGRMPMFGGRPAGAAHFAPAFHGGVVGGHR